MTAAENKMKFAISGVHCFVS